MRKHTLPLFIALAAVGAAARVALLVLPGSPKTDVFYYDTQAVGALLHGMDPYGHAYSVPPSLATPGASMVFAYLPGVFAFLFPAGVVSDVRLGLIVADLLIAASLFSTGGKYGRLCAAVFILLPPTILFSTWFPDDSLPSIAMLSVAFALEARGRRRGSSVMWGLSLASGQLAWLIFPLFVFMSVRLGRVREVVVSVCVAVAAMVPFLLWDPSAFVYDTTLFQFERTAAGVVGSGPFGLSVNPSLEGIAVSAGFSVPLLVRLAATALVLVGAASFVREDQGSLLLASTVFSAAALFLLPEDLFVAYLEFPLTLLLFWLAVRYGGGQSGERLGSHPSLKT